MERQREQNTKSSRSALQRGPLTKAATNKQGTPGPKEGPKKPQRTKPPPSAAPGQGEEDEAGMAASKGKDKRRGKDKGKGKRKGNLRMKKRKSWPASMRHV